MFTMPPKKGTNANASAATKGSNKMKTQPKKQGKQAPRPKVGSAFPTLSCHNPKNVPVGTPTPKCVPLQVESRLPNGFTTNASIQLFAFTNTGASGSWGAQLTGSGAVPNPVGYAHTQQGLSLDSVSGGPVSGRAMKHTIDVRNVTPAGAVGGQVYVLETDSRLAAPASWSALTAAQVTTLCSNIKSAPGVRVFSGSDFVMGRTFSCRVADFKDYEDFGIWYTTVASNGADTGAVVTEYPLMATTNRPMSTVWVLFEPYAGTATYPANVYDIRVLSKYYLRYSTEAVAYSMSRDVPLASQKEIAAVYLGKDFRGASMAV